MSAYVKIKFVLIRVMLGELCTYTRPIGPSDNDFFLNRGLTSIVENELDVKDITDIYRGVLSQYCGQNSGCYFGNDAIVTKRFII